MSGKGKMKLFPRCEVHLTMDSLEQCVHVYVCVCRCVYVYVCMCVQADVKGQGPSAVRMLPRSSDIIQIPRRRVQPL